MRRRKFCDNKNCKYSAEPPDAKIEEPIKVRNHFEFKLVKRYECKGLYFCEHCIGVVEALLKQRKESKV
jgi:hypothetical protein